MIGFKANLKFAFSALGHVMSAWAVATTLWVGAFIVPPFFHAYRYPLTKAYVGVHVFVSSRFNALSAPKRWIGGVAAGGVAFGLFEGVGVLKAMVGVPEEEGNRGACSGNRIDRDMERVRTLLGGCIYTNVRSVFGVVDVRGGHHLGATGWGQVCAHHPTCSRGAETLPARRIAVEDDREFRALRTSTSTVSYV